MPRKKWLLQWIKKVFAHHAKQRYLTTQRAYDQTNEFIGFLGVETLYFNYVWSLICTTTPINNQKPTFDNQKSICTVLISHKRNVIFCHFCDLHSNSVADLPIGALGTCLERQICRGGIGRQIFNKFSEKIFFQKKIFQKNFFNFFFTKIMYIQQRIIEEVRRKTA